MALAQALILPTISTPQWPRSGAISYLMLARSMPRLCLPPAKLEAWHRISAAPYRGSHFGFQTHASPLGRLVDDLQFRAEGPRVRGLSAGGRRIRTRGPTSNGRAR